MAQPISSDPGDDRDRGNDWIAGRYGPLLGLGCAAFMTVYAHLGIRDSRPQPWPAAAVTGLLSGAGLYVLMLVIVLISRFTTRRRAGPR